MPKKSSQTPSVSSPKIPTHQAVFIKLREAILFGDLKPGQAVTIQGLTSMIGAGVTPVREGLRRLISQGALEMHDNRRITVPELTSDMISEIEFMRLALEPELTKRFAARAEVNHIEKLRQIDERLNAAIKMGDVHNYLLYNHAFHLTIYNDANAPIMSQAADRLWLRFSPSLRVVCGRFGTQNLPDKHDELLKALDEGDVDAAGTAIAGDIRQGMDQMLQALNNS
ncbi:MAG: GntR family transcriptional regulator [Lentilitoribacter sp.]